MDYQKFSENLFFYQFHTATHLSIVSILIWYYRAIVHYRIDTFKKQRIHTLKKYRYSNGIDISTVLRFGIDTMLGITATIFINYSQNLGSLYSPYTVPKTVTLETVPADKWEPGDMIQSLMIQTLKINQCDFQIDNNNYY